jgi:hypothetical protein
MLISSQRLMSSLEKFAKFAQPDKLLMVGEVFMPAYVLFSIALTMTGFGRYGFSCSS